MKLNELETDAWEYKNILLSFFTVLFKKYKTLTKSFFSEMNGKRKLLFVVCNSILAVYVSMVFYFFYSTFGVTDISTIRSTIQFLLIAILIFNLTILYCKKSNIYINISGKKNKIRTATFYLYAAVCLFILTTVFIISFPGIMSPDNKAQWDQIQSFKFNNWHPVIHTLILWLITRIYNHYAMVIFFQIFTFSCAVGYLIATIESWGYSKKCLLLAGGFIVLNPSTHGIMMYAWKDTALTIITTFLSAYIINIFLSEGKWFSKIKNIAVFAFCTGLATIVRHNGMFFTIPLMFLSFVLYIKKEPRVIFGILTTALIIFSIRFPIYSVLKVTYPDNVYVESVGIPMTIMGDVLIKNPAALSPETKDFLYKIASDEEWRTEYKTGNYNTIKYNDIERSNSVIRDTPVEKFFKMTIDTIKSDTRNSFHAFRDVTAIVWEVFGSPRVISVPNRDSFMEEQNIIRKAMKICLYGFEQLIACIPPLAWIMTKTGWQMLALLLVGIVSCYRNGGKTLFLIIPLVMYNLGTMLLLCSEDVRFFHFNAVVLPAFVLALLGKNDTVRGGTA